jgi:hypothetical protein
LTLRPDNGRGSILPVAADILPVALGTGRLRAAVGAAAVRRAGVTARAMP